MGKRTNTEKKHYVSAMHVKLDRRAVAMVPQKTNCMRCLGRCISDGHCKFNRLAKKWAKRLRIHRRRPELGSWLFGDVIGGRFRAGCIVCHEQGVDNVAGRLGWESDASIQINKLLRHSAENLKHKKAVEGHTKLHPNGKYILNGGLQ